MSCAVHFEQLVPEADEHGQPVECLVWVLWILKLNQVIVQAAWLAVGECAIVTFTLETLELHESRLPEFEEFAVGQARSLEELRNLDDDLRPGCGRVSYSVRVKAVELPEQELARRT